MPRRSETGSVCVLEIRRLGVTRSLLEINHYVLLQKPSRKRVNAVKFCSVLAEFVRLRV